MHLADNNLKDLMYFSKKFNYNIWIISSMGQKAIQRGKYIPELVINDFEKLLTLLDLDSQKYELLPAMQPDYCVKSYDRNSMKLLQKAIKLLKDNNDTYLLIERYKPVGLNLNLSLNSTTCIAKTKSCTFNEVSYKLKDIGLDLIKRDIGTGYHSPEGIFIWHGKDHKKYKLNDNKAIDIRSICPTILKLYDINIPEYMLSKPFI